MAYTNKQFFDLIKSDVITDAKRSGILASLTAAQAFIESGSGNSGLTQKANALFGIKGSYKGMSVTMKTQEWSASKGYYTVSAQFRAYPSWRESIIDHNDFLLKNSRYHNLIGVKDYRKACQLIAADGYATSPTYAQTLINTIEKFALYEWDQEKPFVPYAATVTATWLKVRSGAGTNYPVVTHSGGEYQLEQGLCVAVHGEVNGWAKISPNHNRWISTKWIQR